MNSTVDFEADGPAGRAIAAYLNQHDERGKEFRPAIRQQVLAEFASECDALRAYFADEDRIEAGREQILDQQAAVDEVTIIRYVGDYALLEHIGSGGMGTVYRARQSTTGRIVAVKLVRNSSPEMLERFRREAQAIANLRHPNIVTLFEAGEHEGEFYYSMDYLENGSLSRAIREARPSPKQAADWTRLIAEALDYAHSKGILHRDIKPQNILLDEQQNPLIADFGLAKLMQDGKPWEQSHAIVGTFAYMPPEQAQPSKAKPGPESDVYSLGATLYEMLTGTPPIQGDNEAELIQHLVAVEPKRIRSVNPAVPRDLETICLKCLCKEPERRYSTARLLASDLERFLRSEPVQARPITALERLARWCRREPFIAGSLLLVGISLLTIATGFGVAFYREQQFSDRLTIAARKLDWELARSLSDQAAIALAANQPLISSHLLGRALTVLEHDPVSNEALASELSVSTNRLERQIRHRLSAQLNALYPIEQVIPLTEPGGDDSMPLLSQLTEAPIKTAVRDSFIGVQFSLDKKYGLVVPNYSTNGDALLYDFVEGRRIASIKLAETSAYFPITFSPSNEVFTLHGRGNSIRRWSLTTGEELPPLTHPVAGEDSTVSDLAFLSNGSKIVSFTVRRNTAFLWDARSGKLLDQLAISAGPAGDLDEDCSAAVLANRVQVAPAAVERPLTLPTDNPLNEKRLEFVDDAAFQVSADGQHAALVLYERLHVFSTTEDGKLKVFVPDMPAHAHLLSSDGSVVVIFGHDAITTFDLKLGKQLAPPTTLPTTNVNFYLDTRSKTLIAFQRDGTRSVINLSSGKVSLLPPLFNADFLVNPIPEELRDFNPAGTSANDMGRIGELRLLEEASVRVEFNNSSPFGESIAIFAGEQLLAPRPSPLLVPTTDGYADVPQVTFLDVPKSLFLEANEYSGQILRLFQGQQRRLGPRLTFLEGGGWLEFHEPSNRLISVDVISATVWGIPNHFRMQDTLKSISIDEDQLVIDSESLLPIGIIEGPTKERDSALRQLLKPIVDSDRMQEHYTARTWKKGECSHYLMDPTGSTVWKIGIQADDAFVVRAHSFHRNDGLQFQREFPIAGVVKSASALPNGLCLLELDNSRLAVLDVKLERPRFLEVIDNGVKFVMNPHDPESDRYDAYNNFPAYCVAISGSKLYFRDKDYQVSVWKLDSGHLSKLPLMLTADYAVMFDAAERYVAVQDSSLKLSIYDLNNLSKPVQTIQTGPEVRTYSFSPSGREILLADDQGHVSFVNLETGAKRLANWKFGWLPPRKYQWLTDARMLTDDGVSRLRDIATQLPLGQPMREHVCLSPDGQVMVNKDSENRHFLWDVDSGQMLGPPLPIDIESEPLHGDVDFHFSADSSWLYILDKGFIRKHPVPMPITGSAQDVQVRIELLTGTTMDGAFTLRGLDGHEWQLRRARK